MNEIGLNIFIYICLVFVGFCFGNVFQIWLRRKRK